MFVLQLASILLWDLGIMRQLKDWLQSLGYAAAILDATHCGINLAYVHKLGTNCGLPSVRLSTLSEILMQRIRKLHPGDLSVQCM